MRIKWFRPFLSITFVVLILAMLKKLNNSPGDVTILPSIVGRFLKFETSNVNAPQSLGVQSERWIIVDGEHVTEEELLKTSDVPGWTILVFGDNVRNYRNKQCTSCVFINSTDGMVGQLSSISGITFKMDVYLFVLLHGAQWVYVTSHISNLKAQLDGFDYGSMTKGLLYEGQMTFDPDRHFGVRDVPADLSVRNQHLSYTLGDYMTPSVQSRWRPTELIRNSGVDIGNVSCRLPRVIVPAKLYPVTELSGSLIEQRSFWVLGSLVGESSPWAIWRILLMKHIGEVIGSYPPSCNSLNFAPKRVEINQDVSKSLESLKCKENMPFYECGIFLATELQKRDHFTTSDVSLVQIWFDALSKVKYKEPHLQKQRKEAFTSGPVHQVVFDQARFNSKLESPFKKICKSTSPPNISANPINDILLVVISNGPKYYSNILYLNYIHRKYFTHILHCGSSLGNFSVFQRQNPNPVSFLENNEIGKGYYGYMCTSYAMEMGYQVKGYLQISDDLLLNMWNIRDLPRDKIWFQSSIRKGNLADPKVPNITPVMKGKKWSVWVSKHGVSQLRSIWENFEVLEKTLDKPRVDSFLGQLSKNFGKGGGAFYEASDIFYVPAKFQDNFNFFAKLFSSHEVHLEIATPTMLCGLDDIKNIVRLQGNYLWYHERNIKNMARVYNIKQHFLHPAKLDPMIFRTDGQKFFCKRYFANLGRNGIAKR